MRVILFDIDGTLLRTGAGRRSMERALAEVFGTPGDPSYRYDGKTDRQIIREAMRLAGFDDATIDERRPRCEALYLEGLATEVANPAHPAEVLPGVHALVEAVAARDDMLLGLLTGNVAAGAALKLHAVGLDPLAFQVGAFGSDHEVRAELPAIARARAEGHLGRAVAGSACVIVGDTPADIQCGRGIGARAVAVATGRYDRAELATHAPHAVFDDLSDTLAVLDALERC
jgi:phosphoglycolate phosphatase-like HAD superfamily hydrolase